MPRTVNEPVGSKQVQSRAISILNTSIWQPTAELITKYMRADYSEPAINSGSTACINNVTTFAGCPTNQQMWFPRVSRRYSHHNPVDMRYFPIDIYQFHRCFSWYLLTLRSHLSWFTVRRFLPVTQHTNVKHLLNTRTVGHINDKQGQTISRRLCKLPVDFQVC